jgi:hypothetical protein
LHPRFMPFWPHLLPPRVPFWKFLLFGGHPKIIILRTDSTLVDAENSTNPCINGASAPTFAFWEGSGNQCFFALFSSRAKVAQEALEVSPGPKMDPHWAPYRSVTTRSMGPVFCVVFFFCASPFAGPFAGHGQSRRGTKGTHMDPLCVRHAKSFAGADGCPVSCFARAQIGPTWAQLVPPRTHAFSATHSATTVTRPWPSK